MEKVRRDTLLGLVFFAGLALLLWATQELNGFSLGERQRLNVDLVNARGLRIGEPVFVLGTQAGRVVEVAVDPRQAEYRVHVEIELDSPLEFKNDAIIDIVDSSLLGGKVVNIDPGTNPATSVDTSVHVFQGTASISPLDSLGEVLNAEGNKENLQEALAGIGEFMDTINSGEGSLSRFIEDDTLIRDAEEFVASLARSAAAIEEQQGLLGRLIYDGTISTRADNIISDLEQVANQLSSTESILGRLINDTEWADRVDQIIADINLVTTGLTGTEGTLGRLINDAELGNQIDTIVSDVSLVTGKLNDPDSGLLGALINGDTLLADARQIFADFADISDQISNGQGALGRLINDEELGRRVDSLIREVTRAIEDAREAAPIGTFFQVFSGAF